ncbi:MAG: hypothetical protein LBR49_06195, partial [Tannerella sp.]|nr:hypothetical protein [Tannerella sp.]
MRQIPDGRCRGLAARLPTATDGATQQKMQLRGRSAPHLSIYLSIYLSICILTSCCGIDDPPCPVEGRWVRVCLDWSESQLDDYETGVASVWFFPEAGGEAKIL